MNIHIDIETRSPVDLTKCGQYVYAAHEATQILCVCWAVEDGPIETWIPGEDVFDGPLPELANLMADPGAVLWAHNASFERILFRDCLVPRYGFPETRLEQWRCTMVLARSYALPGNLENCARVMGMPIGKDPRGRSLISKMCTPPFQYTPALIGQMSRYCEQDVQVERYIHAILPDNVTWQDYHVCERINDRGLRVHRRFAENAAAYFNQERRQIAARFKAQYGFTSPASPLFTRHLYRLILDAAETDTAYLDLIDYLHKEVPIDPYDVDNVRLTLAKDVIETLLAGDTRELIAVLPGDMVRALEIKQEYNRSSASKLEAMVNRSLPCDQRVRGAYNFLGAGKTGRYSSRGLQMHNLPRETHAEYVDVITAVAAGATPDLAELPSLLRPAIYTADDRLFICGDWAAIEARVLPWLSQRPDGRGGAAAEKYLDIFRRDQDVYIDAARNIYGAAADITKAQRQIGKVATLALGYGGSIGAFNALARGYGVTMKEVEVTTIVQGWRDGNPWAGRFWRALQDAAMSAYHHPDTSFPAGRVTYERRGDNLYCVLPSGRELCYLDVREEDPPEDKPWARPSLSAIKSALTPAVVKGARQTDRERWPRENLYGGLFAENVTQAVAADLLRLALRDIDCDYLVGHTHDEILLEVPDVEESEWIGRLTDTMLKLPAWADGLPLAVETWADYHYQK